MASKARESVDFFPLSVDYQEKFASVGRIPGNFFRREARLSDYEVLICRLVDRALRPLFPDGYMNETQVVITLVSAATDGGPANGPSRRPTSHVVSGFPFHFVAYESDATNLVADDDNGVTDIFVTADFTFLVVSNTRASVGPGGIQANGPSRRPYLAADGAAFNADVIVAFESDATNLVPGDTNGATDVFVRNLTTGVLERVSVATGGGQANGPSSIRRISETASA